MTNKKQKMLIYILGTIFLLFAISSFLVLTYLGKQERVGYLEIGIRNEKTGLYGVRINYYDKVFKNSDIYEVYVKMDSIPDEFKNIKWDSDGSPFGNMTSENELSSISKIDNVYYTLKLNPLFKYTVLFLILVIALFTFFKEEVKRIFLHRSERELTIISQMNIARTYYIFIVAISILSFLYYLNIPLWGDDWWYATVKNFQEIYTIKKDWHPGRHITEFLHIFPSRVLGTILGFAINNPLLGVKIIHALVATTITIGLWVIIGKFYNFNNRKLPVVLFIVMSIFLNKMYVEFTITSQIWGGYLMSLICFSPIAYFFTRGKLPAICSSSPNKFYGIWLAVIYIGTQVFDIAAWIIAGLSFLAIIYLILNKDDYKKERKTIIKLSLTIILFTIFAMIRNTFFSEYGGSFVQNERLYIKILQFDIAKILKANISMFSGFSIMFGMIFLFYYLYKNIKMKFKDRETFFILSLLVIGYSTLHISVDVLDRYADLSIVIIWIALINILLKAYNDNRTFALYILPTLILGLVIGSVGQFEKTLEHPNTSRRYFISQKLIERVIPLYQEADAQNRDYLIASKSKAEELKLAFYVPEMWIKHMSIWMNSMGYTKKVLPVVIVDDDEIESIEKK